MFGIILISKINEAKRSNAIMAMLAKKRTYLRQKLVRRKLRFLNRRPRSCWVKPGRTDLWWESIRTGVAPEECLKKNFRMPRDSFINLVPIYFTGSTLTQLQVFGGREESGSNIFFKRYRFPEYDCHSFGIAVNTASAVITEVCQVISKTRKVCGARCQN